MTRPCGKRIWIEWLDPCSQQGIRGDTSDNDEICAIAGLKANAG